MKFILTYDGTLSSNGKQSQKSDIRKSFSPQLKRLWDINPALREVRRSHRVPIKPGYFVWETHHTSEVEKELPSHIPDDWVDVLEPIKRGTSTFFPLVRNSLALQCGLKILFMRQEEPGRVYQGGDLDNRLKTLFDALAIPTVKPTDRDLPDPTYCLLEDDSLITACSVETHRLLSLPNASPHEVRLVIEVDVKVSQARNYNLAFLGD